MPIKDINRKDVLDLTERIFSATSGEDHKAICQGFQEIFKQEDQILYDALKMEEPYTDLPAFSYFLLLKSNGNNLPKSSHELVNSIFDKYFVGKSNFSIEKSQTALKKLKQIEQRSPEFITYTVDFYQGILDLLGVNTFGMNIARLNLVKSIVVYEVLEKLLE